MSIQAAQRIGLRCLSYDPSDDCCAGQIAMHLVGSFKDAQTMSELFAKCDYVTFENEFVPAEVVVQAMHKADFDPTRLTPRVEVLATIQDKWLQRQALNKAGVNGPKVWMGSKVAPWHGKPRVFKARKGGYDGKGTLVITSEDEFNGMPSYVKTDDWIEEEFVEFKRELAVMVDARSDGLLAYPTVETVQKNQVCDTSVPCDLDASLIAIAAIKAVSPGMPGLFGVELFELENGEIWVNEIAPRPHNTGHYTLDWGGPSQFETHIRTVLGLPPAELKSDGCCAMANLLGQDTDKDYRPHMHEGLDEHCFFHWYGKESRPGRKVGHINGIGSTPDEALNRATAARERFYKAWTGK